MKTTLLVGGIVLLSAIRPAWGQKPLSAADLLSLKYAGNIQISPSGGEAVYSVSTPRGPNDEPGPAVVSWYRISLPDGEPVKLFPDSLKISSPQYSPDGRYIGFILRKGSAPGQVWARTVNGTEMFRLTGAEEGVSYFRWQPGRKGIAYLSKEPATPKEKELEERGYDFIFYEENLKNDNLFYSWFGENWDQTGLWQLTDGVQVWDFEFDHQGNRIAASISPKNLIDHRYMFRKIHLIDLESGDMEQVSENEGKLGNYAFSPDGTYLAYGAALNLHDHAVSQAYVVHLESGEVTNLTPDNFRGHVTWVDWKDNSHVLYYSGEGVYPTLSVVPVTGGERNVILHSREVRVVFSTPSCSKDFNYFVFTGSTPYDRSNIYYWDGKGPLSRLTDLNPVLADRKMGRQEVVRYQARDGQEIEGLMIHPVGYTEGKTYPLIVYVHGGPESHHSNEWLSRYSRPGQVMAGKGYLVLYLNYRASTGYGVKFAMEGYMDAAGTEFDDIADGIEWAVSEKGADPARVGLAGGSYGGFASAWFATFYTRYVKAVCMFVGISDLISKRGTTDIPYEELYVHSGKLLEETWQQSLERSPIYWAHQSETATLIYGGAEDTRVHPSQSLELYRRMKMNDHPAVRLVQYPGEGHGNRKQVGRIDVLYRQMEWFDWYVMEDKPLEGPMPPLDISDRYGIEF